LDDFEPAVERTIEDEVARRGERTTPHREWLLDPPDLLAAYRVPGDELAFVTPGSSLLRRVAADVRRAGDVRHLTALEIHTQVVRRHVEEPRLRGERRGLLILSALEAGTDVLHVPALRRLLVDVDVRPARVEIDARRPVHRHECFGEEHLPRRAIDRVGEAV